MDFEKAKLLDHDELEMWSISDSAEPILPTTEPSKDIPPAPQNTGLHPAWFIT